MSCPEFFIAAVHIMDISCRQADHDTRQTAYPSTWILADGEDISIRSSVNYSAEWFAKIDAPSLKDQRERHAL